MSGSSLEGTDAFHYELVHLLSPSSFKVKSDGRRAKNTSLDRLRIYSRPLVTDEDHVCQNCRGDPGGQNRDIHLTFSGPRLQHATGTMPRLPSLATLGNYQTVRLDTCNILPTSAKHVMTQLLFHNNGPIYKE